jgi:methionine aminopeptidase
LVKIVKRGDTYKPEKLEASIKAAGASNEVAKKVVSSIKVHEGMSTLEIRKQTSDLLKNLDAKAARKYDAFTK